MVTDPWGRAKSTFDEKNLLVRGLWCPVADLLPVKRVIKFVVSGSWAVFGPTVPKCGPEGYHDYGVAADQLILTDSPTGALIGKIGGSTANRKDGTIFAIGALCVLSPLEKAAPLFVAVNGGWRTGSYRIEELKIEIFDAQLDQATG